MATEPIAHVLPRRRASLKLPRHLRRRVPRRWRAGIHQHPKVRKQIEVRTFWGNIRRTPAGKLALENAYALSRLHGGSSVAVVDAVGHCALLATTSACMYGIVQEYFHTGKVPVNGTVCEAECVPHIPFKACPGLPA